MLVLALSIAIGSRAWITLKKQQLTDAQLEIRQLCDLMWPHMVDWAPEFAAWYEKSRLHRARLAP